MSNVVQYVRDYGYIPFSQMAFAAADNIALCTVFYMPFEDVVSESFSAQPMPFDDACRQLFEKRGFQHEAMGLLLTEETSVLMMEMSQKQRFAEMRVAACRSYLSTSPMVQFAAMTFLLPNHKIVVVFRGTDDTMEGWAEDLDMISSDDGMPSAQDSLEYLRQAAAQFEGDIILCGHSKGGHNAVYAALHADDAIQKRIIAVYNNDGPGFSDDRYMDTDAYRMLLRKYHHFVPRSSFFGMMLHHDDDFQLVRSSKLLGPWQHDLLTWQFEGCRLKLTRSDSLERKRNHVFFREWVCALNEAEIAAAYAAAHALIEHTDSTRLIEVKRNFPGFAKHTFDAFSSLDKDTKKTINSVVKKLLSAVGKAIKENP